MGFTEAVLGVGPSEGVLACGDIEAVVEPARISQIGTMIQHSLVVNVEITVIPIGTSAFTHTFRIKLDGAISSEGYSDGNTRG